jgi:hypothetical protein
MSISASSRESNKHYESNSRAKFRAVLFRSLGVLVREPAKGYDRIYLKKDHPDNSWWVHGQDTMIQIDIVGHVSEEVNLPSTANVDPNNPNWQVFILKKTPACSSSDEINSVNIFVKDSPEKPLETYTSETSVDNIILEVKSTAKFKYVIGEVTEGGKKSITGKIAQLEKDCAFICSKVSRNNTNDSVSQIISFVMLIAPFEDTNYVQNIVESNATMYPLVYRLLCKGRFVYIINRETTTAIVKQLKEETTNLTDQFQEHSQQVEQLRRDLDELKEQTIYRLDEFKEETSNRLDQFKEETSNRLDETNNRLDQFKEETSNRLDKIQAALNILINKSGGAYNL